MFVKLTKRRERRGEKQKKEKMATKNVSAGLGAMFESDSSKNESSFSSDSSDEDFCLVQKRKRG